MRTLPLHFTSLFILAGLLLFNAASAQENKTTFRGVVIDESDQPLPGATIMLLDAADSVLVTFTSTDQQGSFVLKNIPRGEYLLNVNFLGLEPLYKSLTSGLNAESDLGKMKMVVASKTLSEVEVTAQHIPIEIKKDTILYNADAYETQPNADVEELLKKLPGIEVQSDGSIKAQGEDVQKVLVDGKEFFGDDPKMATKNLPAKAVKKVKVYDKQSDMAEFTGVDDGDSEKTIDLELREEFKQGLFGNAEAGYGSDSRYKGYASINRFSKSSQLSFLGQLNNINQQGFSFTDQMNFSGGMRGGRMGGGNREFRITSDIPFSDGTGTGLVNTGAAGINFNWHKTKKFSIRSSYFFNSVDKSLLQESLRQNISDNPFDTEEDLSENTGNKSHRVSLYSDIKPDSMQQFELNGSIGFGDREGTSESFLQNSIPGGSIESRSTSVTNSGSDNLNANASLMYMRKLGKKGRNLSGSIDMSTGSDEADNELAALTEYLTTGSTEALDQLQFSISESMTMGGQFSYTEPLKKRRFVEFSYAYNQTESDYDKRVSDLVNEIPIENPGLSNTYSSLFDYHRPGITFRYSGETQNINAGLQYQVSELRGHINSDEQEIIRKYNHFLPRFIWRNDIGNGKNMRFHYTTRVNQPSITQLSPVIDNTDPLRLYVGNPELNAEYNHNASLNLHSFTQFSSTSFFASLSGSLTNNKIITSKSIQDQLLEISSPINIDEETRISLYASFGRPLKLIHSRFNINANLSRTNTQNVINDELLDLNRWTRSGGITFSNLNSKVLEYSIGGKLTFSDSYYTSDATLDQSTLLHNYFAELTLTLWKKWKLHGSYDYNLYTSESFEDDQSLPLMELSISRFILPNDRGQIKLSVFDALDENRGLSRTSEVNYIEEIRSNSIGRYAMLSFIYSIKGSTSEPAGAIRIIERR